MTILAKLCLVAVPLLVASPASAQFQRYQPVPIPQAPDLGAGYQRAIQGIAPPSQPTISVQPAPLGGYTVRQGNERSLDCRPGPLGGFDCQ